MLVASAFSIAQLVVGRIILGIGVGFATQATPLYLSEMAPYNLRGALNILFQLAVTIGKSLWMGLTRFVVAVSHVGMLGSKSAAGLCCCRLSCGCYTGGLEVLLLNSKLCSGSVVRTDV